MLVCFIARDSKDRLFFFDLSDLKIDFSPLFARCLCSLSLFSFFTSQDLLLTDVIGQEGAELSGTLCWKDLQ